MAGRVSGVVPGAPGEAVNLDEEIKSLKVKVDALRRTMQGGGAGKGLERGLLWDGFDERAGRHTEPSLTKQQMLELFQEAIGKLDEVGRHSSQLVRSLGKHGERAVVPAELPFNYAEIPAATISILPAPVQSSREALLQAAHDRIASAGGAPVPPERSAALQEQTKHLLEESIAAPLARVRDEIRSVRGGAGLRKQPRTSYETGFSDPEVEHSIIGAVCGEASALRVITECQRAGIRSIDFVDRENEKCWEALEKIKSNNMLTSDRTLIVPLLKKELGDAKKQYILKREQLGKKNAPCDLEALIKRLLSCARLRRAVDATHRGIGLREGPGGPLSVGSGAGVPPSAAYHGGPGGPVAAPGGFAPTGRSGAVAQARPGIPASHAVPYQAPRQ
jgi:hypothetical protein